MRLGKLSLINFKNFAQQEIVLGEGINCFVGDNGAGKTNIIDAIHYLSMCKSSLVTDTQSLKHGEEFFLIDGHFQSPTGRTEQITCSYSRKGGKIVKRNGKEYEKLADHIGVVPAVIVSPADSVLISDAAEERRRYLNAFISQLDHSYLHAAMRYNAVLQERNKYLKIGSNEDMLLIYDMQLSEQAERIHSLRAKYIEELSPMVSHFYNRLSEHKEQVSLSYHSELNTAPLSELLLQSRQRDIVNQHTTVGVHRDDMVLKIDDYPLRRFGSQGQQKSFLISLKLAQYSIISKECGKRPILLLDDLFDKLDTHRVTQLLKLVSEEQFGQIVITDCNPTRLKSILDKASMPYTLFTVLGGAIEQ